MSSQSQHNAKNGKVTGENGTGKGYESGAAARSLLNRGLITLTIWALCQAEVA